MKATKNFLGFDIGASSGKAVVGRFDGEKLFQEELHRFDNTPVSVRGGLYWKVLSLFSEIKRGLAAYSKKYDAELSGVGIDTWGVDFGLLDERGNLLGNPYHYRDSKNTGMAEKVERIIGGYEIYRTTGMKADDIRTISQMYALKELSCPQLKVARRFLMMPCLLSYFLGGDMVQEHSIITPTCLYDINKNKPAEEFFSKLGIPSGMMGSVVKPGTCIGKIDSDIAHETGLQDVPLMAPAMHDSASAVIAVPADKKTDWAFISSGTWCVVGVESPEPVISQEGYRMNIVNSATAEGKYMFIGNITGLWLIQECKRLWESTGEGIEYAELLKLAEQSPRFHAFIDVDDKKFAGFTDMPKSIMDYCSETGQKIPRDRGTLTRVILESIAMKERQVMDNIQHLTGRKHRILHIEGGGIKNRLLCQFTSSAAGIPVIAGPAEGTVLGNIIMQMVADGAIGSVDEGRAVVRKSVALDEYEPEDGDLWQEAYERYKKITERKEIRHKP